MIRVLATITLLFLAGAAHAAKTTAPTALQATISIFDNDRKMVTEKILEVREALLENKDAGKGGAPTGEKIEARIKALNEDLGWKITSAGNGELCFRSGSVYSMRNWESFSAKGSTPDGVVITSYFQSEPSGKINFDDGHGHYIVLHVSPSDVQVVDANLPFLPTDFVQRLFLFVKTENKGEFSKHLTGYFRSCATRTDTNFYKLAIYLLKVPAQRNDFLEWLTLNEPALQR